MAQIIIAAWGRTDDAEPNDKLPGGVRLKMVHLILNLCKQNDYDKAGKLI